MIKYDLMAVKDPRGSDMPMLHCARIVRGDTVEYEDLIRLISKMSSLNYGVIQGVLGTLIDVVEEQFQFGRTVRLGDLGTLFMTLKSQSTESPEDFGSANIEGGRIRFLPSKKLKRAISQLQFERVKSNGDQNDQ